MADLLDKDGLWPAQEPPDLEAMQKKVWKLWEEYCAAVRELDYAKRSLYQEYRKRAFGECGDRTKE